MIYLSRLLLNPRSRQVKQEMRDLYQQHRTIMSAFPQTLPETERVLYRLDIQPRIGQVALLVQSHTEPDWDNLIDKDYLLPEDPFNYLPNPAVKSVELIFRAGQKLGFRLRANPTKRLLRDDPERGYKKGQRIGLYSEEEQRAWLLRKAQEGGYAVLEVNLSGEGTVTGKTKMRYNLNLLAVRFEGLLQVNDPGLFLKTVQAGIGSGKGLGFGLLSLAPA